MRARTLLTTVGLLTLSIAVSGCSFGTMSSESAGQTPTNAASVAPTRLAEDAGDGAWFSKDIEVCVHAGPTSRGVVVAPNTGTNYTLQNGEEQCRTAEFPGATVQAMAGSSVFTFIYAGFNPPIGYPTMTITTARRTYSHGFSDGEPWDVPETPVHIDRRSDTDVKRFVITIG